MKRFTTREAAAKLHMHRVTLQRLIAAKRIPAPEMQSIGGGLVRLWTERDIERAERARKAQTAKQKAA